MSDEFVEARFCAPAAISWLERLKDEPRGCDVDDCFCSSAEVELARPIMARTLELLDGYYICYY